MWQEKSRATKQWKMERNIKLQLPISGMLVEEEKQTPISSNINHSKCRKLEKEDKKNKKEHKICKSSVSIAMYTEMHVFEKGPIYSVQQEEIRDCNKEEIKIGWENMLLGLMSKNVDKLIKNDVTNDGKES